MGQQYELDLRAREAGLEVHLARNVPALLAFEPDAGKTGLKPRSQKAQPSLVPSDAIAFDAFRLTLVQCRWHIAANMMATAEGREPEALHQLRVALRRLRVALASFGGEFRTPQLEAIKLRAKFLAEQLAPARDLDVFLTELFEPAASANGSRDAFAILRARAEAARRRAWNDAAQQVMGPRFRMFMADLVDAIDRGVWPLAEAQHRGASKGLVALQMPARDLAGRMLTHRRRQACKRAKGLDSLSDAGRHELRISLKKLRYTAEFFAPFFDRPRVQKFVSRLSRMQDVLGALNDVAVAREILESLVSTDGPGGTGHSDLSFAAGIVYGWHLERAAHAWQDAVARWKNFADAGVFWNAAAQQ
ncbi:MAG TPA: CHAD domain-containing protein [Rhizomicrobium sp.]|nr:CHAD domain-containing protein [Rhizomicrobium sp.]